MTGPPDIGPPPGVDVWHVELDIDGPTAGRAAMLLDSREQRRAEAFRDELTARRFVAAHGAARTVLGDYLGVAASAVEWSVGEHGKPSFDGTWKHWQWSMSRAGGHALIAVRLAEPVGVDIETVGEHTPALSLAIRFLEESEAEAVEALTDPDEARLVYHQLLSRKEACVKSAGGRLLDALRIRVLTPGTVTGVGVLRGHRWQLYDLPAPPGFVAALATLGTSIDQLRLFEWRWDLLDRAPAELEGQR